MNTKEIKLPTQCGSSNIERPRFSPAQLLDDEDMNAVVNYTRDLTRLLFRSLFGCGVICGLEVGATPICAGKKWQITVSKGLALDCLGNPIEVPSQVTVEYDPGCEDFVKPLWVAICYCEKCCRPKDVACSPSDSTQLQQTRVRSGYEVKLYGALPDCACHCPTDDDKPKPKAPSDCCDDAAQPPAPAASTATATAAIVPAQPISDICACYKSHFQGVCECGCCCSCVVIGKITDMPAKIGGKEIHWDKQTAQVDYGMVRRIRPILNGYVDCGSLKFVPPTAQPRSGAAPVPAPGA